MKEIGAAALKYLASLEYRPDAEMVVGMIPLTGIYWVDEIPDNHQQISLLPEMERLQVYGLFCMRKLIWRGQHLSREQQELWQSVQTQVPNCPLFQRLEPSRTIVRADRRIERRMDACEAAMAAEVELKNHP